jgi:hypothetical protein
VDAGVEANAEERGPDGKRTENRHQAEALGERGEEGRDREGRQHEEPEAELQEPGFGRVRSPVAASRFRKP